MTTHPIHFRHFCKPSALDHEHFYVSSIGHDTWRGNSQLLRRGHRYHLLMLTLSGAATGKVNNSPIYAETDSIWIFPRNKTYTYSWNPDVAEWTYYWIEFDGQWASTLLEMMHLNQEHDFHNCSNSAEIVRTIIDEVIERGDDAQHYASSLLCQVFAQMERSRKHPTRSKQQHSVDTIAKKFMADHLKDAIQLEDVAAYVKLSPFHLSRIFKNINGIPPMTYLRHLRVARAKALFNRKDMSISEVGVAVGYPIIQHFSRMFKSETGLTPRAFINAHA